MLAQIERRIHPGDLWDRSYRPEIVDLPPRAVLVLGLPRTRDMRITTSRTAQDTPITIRLADPASENAIAVVVPESGADVEAVERALIEFALERTHGNRTRAAQFLALSRSALIYRMHKHGLAKDAGAPEPGNPEGSSHP